MSLSAQAGGRLNVGVIRGFREIVNGCVDGAASFFYTVGFSPECQLSDI